MVAPRLGALIGLLTVLSVQAFFCPGPLPVSRASRGTPYLNVYS